MRLLHLLLDHKYLCAVPEQISQARRRRLAREVDSTWSRTKDLTSANRHDKAVMYVQHLAASDVLLAWTQTMDAISVIANDSEACAQAYSGVS